MLADRVGCENRPCQPAGYGRTVLLEDERTKSMFEEHVNTDLAHCWKQKFTDQFSDTGKGTSVPAEITIVSTYSWECYKHAPDNQRTRQSIRVIFAPERGSAPPPVVRPHMLKCRGTNEVHSTQKRYHGLSFRAIPCSTCCGQEKPACPSSCLLGRKVHQSTDGFCIRLGAV